MKPDCYDYVRGYYNVPAYIGMRVRINGREGVLVKHSKGDQYVHVYFDGDKARDWTFHPTDDVEYLVVGVTR